MQILKVKRPPRMCLPLGNLVASVKIGTAGTMKSLGDLRRASPRGLCVAVRFDLSGVHKLLPKLEDDR